MKNVAAITNQSNRSGPPHIRSGERTHFDLLAAGERFQLIPKLINIVRVNCASRNVDEFVFRNHRIVTFNERFDNLDRLITVLVGILNNGRRGGVVTLDLTLVSRVSNEAPLLFESRSSKKIGTE